MSAERPREIDNAATGETVRFVRTAEETGGELLVLEAVWTDPAHVTPAHVHPTMEERWLMLPTSPRDVQVAPPSAER